MNEYLGIPLVVKPSRDKSKKKSKSAMSEADSIKLCHEVKRVGLLIDRYVDLEMRVGDHLVIYISKS